MIAAGPTELQGKLLENLVHFARALRYSGISVGTGQIAKAIRAVSEVGFSTKQDLFWILHTSFVTKPEHLVVFEEIFRLFWKDPRFHDQMMSFMLPSLRGVAEKPVPKSGMRRAASALLGDISRHKHQESHENEGVEQIEILATGTTSSIDKLKMMDFEQMTPEEVAEAKQAITQLKLPVKPLKTRRTKPHPSGSLADWRATMQIASRQGGELSSIRFRRHKQKYPDLIALCDISGSMSNYSRMLLHFLHTVANKKGLGWSKVHTFTFGTKLTNITRNLSIKDIDVAIESAGKEAGDWEGGTRIGECLKTFSFQWSRRVLSRGSIILLITDGLEGGNPELLEAEIKRIRRSSLKLIWLNPLLRWQDFAPKARGIMTILPHVDCVVSAHSINSLTDLATAISSPDDHGSKKRLIEAMATGGSLSKH